jgi:hypothetical protein
MQSTNANTRRKEGEYAMDKNTQSQLRTTDLSELDSLLLLNANHSRNIAISAGDFRQAVARAVDRIVEQRPGNQLKAAKVGLQRLYEDQLITSQELTELNQICRIIFSAQNGKGDQNDASAKIHTIYGQMKSRKVINPVALAIASIASSGEPRLNGAQGRSVMAAAANRSNKVDLGMVGGAV